MIEHLASRNAAAPPRISNTPHHVVCCEPGLMDLARHAWMRISRAQPEACGC